MKRRLRTLDFEQDNGRSIREAIKAKKRDLAKAEATLVTLQSELTACISRVKQAQRGIAGLKHDLQLLEDEL